MELEEGDIVLVNASEPVFMVLEHKSHENQTYTFRIEENLWRTMPVEQLVTWESYGWLVDVSDSPYVTEPDFPSEEIVHEKARAGVYDA